MREEGEYSKKCFDIFKNGGSLWLIEREDTNEFLYQQFLIQNSSNLFTKTESWSKDISYFTVFFLSEEDAIKGSKLLNLSEGGCSCCGHGSIITPYSITEHEFVKK